MRISYKLVPTRPPPHLHPSGSPPEPPHRASILSTLAAFLNRPLRPSHRRNRPRSSSQPPAHRTGPSSSSRTQLPSVIPIPIPTVPLINQSNPSEPVYSSISRFYRNREPTPEPRHVSWTPARDNLPHVPYNQVSVHQIPVQTQDLHCHYPEEIFVSSVLPTRTPRELRYFQDHCWNIFQNCNGQESAFSHDLEKSRQITTSPLHFQNLLWRSRVIVNSDGIVEEYYWIKRRTRPDRPDRPYLEPAYSVISPWFGSFWHTEQLERPLPPRPE